jgi:hypothetical protein
MQDNVAAHGRDNNYEKEDASAYFFIDAEKESEAIKKAENSINLKETSTFFLINLPSICFSAETANIEHIKQINQKYQEVNISIF